MNLHDVNRGIQKHKKMKRVGRGSGSGHGKTSGRGHKGQGQLAGWTHAPGVRRRPDAALSPHSEARLQQPLGAQGRRAVNVGDLNESFEAGAEITPESLKPAPSRVVTTC